MNDYFTETGTTISSPEWASLARFFHINWFWRKWVFQETVLASTLTITCGQFVLPVESFYLAVNALFYAGIAESMTTDPLDSDACAFQGFNTMLTARRELPRLNPAVPVLSRARVFRQATSLEASDPRDCIYGLLGLFEYACEGHQIPIEVDYSLSTADTLINATIWCIQNENNFDILCSTTQRKSKSLKGKLPSWVPDVTSSVSQYHTHYAVETKDVKNVLAEADGMRKVMSDSSSRRAVLESTAQR